MNTIDVAKAASAAVEGAFLDDRTRLASTSQFAQHTSLFIRVLLVMVSVLTETHAQDRFEGLDAYIRDGMATWKVPGLAVAVIKDGKIEVARAYGIRQLGQDGRVGDDTLFSIASCTKPFTATCVAMLVDEGKLKWDDPVRLHLPEFKVADPYVTENLTIRDLLCHRTGLVHADFLGTSGGFTHAQMLNQIQFVPQAAPFRSKVTYSNLMFSVLGEIIERKSSMSWENFVTKRILEPLELRSTTTDRDLFDSRRVATRHRLYDGQVSSIREPTPDSMKPAGAIYSTPTDMASWLAFQLREGEHSGRPLLAKDTLREMQAVHQSIPVKWQPSADEYDSRFIGTGLGWFVREYRGRKVVQHGGAWGAEMAMLPEEKLGVVVLSNRDWNGLAWMLIYDLMDAYLVGPEQAWKRGAKWERWLKIGGPDLAERDVKEERAKLEMQRKATTRPSLPMVDYTGRYESSLYPPLNISIVQNRLHVTFGDFAADLDHWEQDSFYAKAVIVPFFDWLVEFQIDQQKVKGLEIIHVGWKHPDERFLFRRVK